MGFQTGTVTFSGLGDLIIDTGATLNLDGSDTVQVDLINNGTVNAFNTSNSITGAVTNPAGSTINIDSTGGFFGALTVSNGFTNAGTIVLDNQSTTGHDSSLTVSSGTLANTGTLQTRDTGSLVGEHNITAQITNTGLIDIDQNTVLNNNTRTFNSTAGTIDVETGEIFRIERGTFAVGTGTVLQGGEIGRAHV